MEIYNDLHLLSILLLAVSSSLDNFGVGVSYGMRNICIPLSLNLVIAFVNSCGTLFSMLFGKGFSGHLKPLTAGYIGAFLLIGIGLWIIVTEFLKKETERPYSEASSEKISVRKKNLFSRTSSFINDPFAAGVLCSGRVTMKEGAILALALSLSNISTGIAAGMIGFNPSLTTIAIFNCSLLAIAVGEKIGHYSGARMIKKITGIAAGLLLVVVGLYEMHG